MGLPDTLKAKNLFENRKQLINKALSEFDAKNNDKVFNFDEVLNNSEKDVGKNWKSITEKDPEANKTFPIIDYLLNLLKSLVLYLFTNLDCGVRIIMVLKGFFEKGITTSFS